MNCYSCGKSDWENIPKEVNEQSKILSVCKECGAIAYQVEKETEETVKKYYRKDYRANTIPNMTNLLTTTHKLNYIKVFLGDFLKDKKDLIIGDVGCATGYLLNWFKGQGHKVVGSELTTSFRRFCEHFYGIPIAEELGTKHKYDLISIYHVLEHLIEPDKKLEYYKSLLKDDGYFLISMPNWLNDLEEASGTEFKGFENYFHVDHINIFTETSLKNIFKKLDLKIIKEDFYQYGQTYLLQKQSANIINEPIIKQDWQKVRDTIFSIKKASDCYQQKKMKEAIEHYTRFPEAHLSMIFDTYKKDPSRQQAYFTELFNGELKENMRLKMSYAVWLYQNEKWEEALEGFSFIFSIKPSEDILMYMGWCYGILKQPQKAMACFYQAQEMCPLKWAEAMNWMCKMACEMPTWDEIATAKFKEKVFEENKEKLKLEMPTNI